MHLRMDPEKTMDETKPEQIAAKKVLLVDDDPEIIEAIRYALESRGYQIFIARDGNQGLAMAEREDPDLVILDMMMPKRSGFLVLEKLRRTRPVPVRVAPQGNHRFCPERAAKTVHVRHQGSRHGGRAWTQDIGQQARQKDLA